MTFTVKTQTFEGPLDLLLDLIEKHKLFISDIALAKVTDDFIDHVKQFENLPMGELAHFILVASTLLLIKSKSLLPELNLTEEEQGDIHDLETRLKIYKHIKEASKNIEKMFGEEVIFGQSQSRAFSPVFAPDPQFSLERALNSLKDLVNRLPKSENLPKVAVKKILSLEDMIGNLTKRITTQLRMSFNQFTAEHKGEKINIIVSFLAMLELVKHGVLQVSQSSQFADIEMETKEVGVPTY
ncbi:MAG: ScpA family protein [Candidatus Taylorbacteria bacterium]|nr:ScpA family protein [Candidatus Taylorbacteria bacterium]